MNRTRWKYLLPGRRKAEEREMREELDSLARMEGADELGSLVLAAENARQTWHLTAFDGVFADFRYALRTLRRKPGFVAVAVLSLAGGIGANSAIFSFADATMFRPLPVASPAEVLNISNATPDNVMEGLSYPDYEDVRERSRSFAGVAAYRSASIGVGARADVPPQMRLASLVSGNFFTVLQVVAPVGRTFLPEEGRVPGGDAVAVLGYDFWKSEYGGDSTVIGRTVRLNGIEFVIAGVAPQSFPGMERFFPPSVFVPFSMAGRLEGEHDQPLEDRGRHELTVVGRLRDGVKREAARAELTIIAHSLERAYPATNRNRQLVVRTALEARIRQAPQQLVLVTMLMLLAGLVLIIACANVANLMLARARARNRRSRYGWRLERDGSGWCGS